MFARILLTAAVAGSLAVPAAAQHSMGHHDASKPPSKAQIAKVRAATAKYKDVRKAIADGFTPTEDCVTDPNGGGAMGLHYANVKNILDRKADPAKPDILLYERRPGGGVRLNGVEWMVLDRDQNVATRDRDLPHPLGQAMNGPMLGHAPGQPIHTDLHMWLYKKNPKGMFASYNPAVHC